MENSYEKLNESLKVWAAHLQLSTRQELIKSLYLSFLRSSQIIGQFTAWLLAIVGATAGLIISNVDSIGHVLPNGNIKVILILLLLSGISGVISKYFDIMIQTNLSVIEQLEKMFQEVLRKHEMEEQEIEKTAKPFVEPPDTEVNLKEILGEFLEPFPSLYRKKALKEFELGAKDPLWTYKRVIKVVIWRGFAILMQAVFFMIAILSVVIGL